MQYRNNDWNLAYKKHNRNFVVVFKARIKAVQFTFEIASILT